MKKGRRALSVSPAKPVETYGETSAPV
jgi:hypothetical protein